MTWVKRGGACLFGTRLGEAVARAAGEFGADLVVVVGTHGRKGLGRVRPGGGAGQVIRLARVAVLVVRHPQAPAA